jgi:hypothetical protein
MTVTNNIYQKPVWTVFFVKNHISYILPATVGINLQKSSWACLALYTFHKETGTSNFWLNQKYKT